LAAAGGCCPKNLATALKNIALSDFSRAAASRL